MPNKYIGVGIDIINIERILRLWSKHNTAFSNKFLSMNEKIFLQKITHFIKAANFLAKCFSIKESVFKALGGRFREDILLKQICVNRDNFGKPNILYVVRIQKFIDIACTLNTYISLSDNDGVVISHALIIITPMN